MDQSNAQQTRSLSVVPDSVSSTIAESYVCEFSVLRKDGTPITLPMGNYPDADGNPEVSVGLTFPWTSELARRNPKVCISYCRATHPTLARPPLVVISGHAAVRDADLQANTDRYVWWLEERFPEMFGRMPRPMLKWMSFYLARIWIHVTPVRISWWPEGDITGSPQRWEAPQDQHLPESDPPPHGPPSRIPSPFAPPEDWQPGLDDALNRLGPPLLIAVDDDGFPTTDPALDAARTQEGGDAHTLTNDARHSQGPGLPQLPHLRVHRRLPDAGEPQVHRVDSVYRRRGRLPGGAGAGLGKPPQYGQHAQSHLQGLANARTPRCGGGTTRPARPAGSRMRTEP